MNDPAGWEWIEQVNAERYAMAVAALNRCAAAGAHPEDVVTLARECGIDLNLIKLKNPKGT